MSAPISNVRPKPDAVLTDIADYVADYTIALNANDFAAAQVVQ